MTMKNPGTDDFEKAFLESIDDTKEFDILYSNESINANLFIASKLVGAYDLGNNRNQYKAVIDYSKKLINNCCNCNNIDTIEDENNKIRESKLSMSYPRLYDLLNDVIWYNRSRLSNMHIINLYFINELNRSEEYKRIPRYQKYHNLWNFTYTPRSSEFKNNLWRYMLKNSKNEKLSSIMYLFLFNRSLTKYGLQNINNIVQVFDLLINEYEKRIDTTLINSIISEYKIRDINRMKKFEKLVKAYTRDAENIVRTNNNIPKIGEGWIGETVLFENIRNEFDNNEVVQHGRPKFLGRQHLDIWIPKLKLGIEYQGDQHYNPIEYFGGENAFSKQTELDRRKKELCDLNGVVIIYVNKEYDFDEVICSIKKYSSKKAT